MSVQVDQRHGATGEVPGSPEDAPGERVVTSDSNHSAGRIPKLFCVEVGLVHGRQDVERVPCGVPSVVYLHVSVVLLEVWRVVEGESLGHLPHGGRPEPRPHPVGGGGVVRIAEEHAVGCEDEI